MEWGGEGVRLRGHFSESGAGDVLAVLTALAQIVDTGRLDRPV